MTTLELRNEYRRAPKLSMLVSNGPLVACIRQGIESEVFLYREGARSGARATPRRRSGSPTKASSTPWPTPKKALWPRAEPLVLNFTGVTRPDRAGPKIRPHRGRLGGRRALYLQRQRPRSDPRKQESDNPEVRGLPRPERDLPGGSEGQPGAAGNVDHPRRPSSRPASWPSGSGPTHPVTLGKATRIGLSIHGGKGPFTIHEAAELNLGSITATSHEVRSGRRVDDLLRRGQRRSGGKGFDFGPGHGGDSQGPHSPRKARWPRPSPSSGRRLARPRSPAVEKLVITLLRRPATWKVHQAMATLKEARQLPVRGRHQAGRGQRLPARVRRPDGRANAVKSFLDPQLRTAADTTSPALTRSAFRHPLSTDPGQDRRVHQEPDSLWQRRSLRRGRRGPDGGQAMTGQPPKPAPARPGTLREPAPVRATTASQKGGRLRAGDLAEPLARHAKTDRPGICRGPQGLGPQADRAPTAQATPRGRRSTWATSTPTRHGPGRSTKTWPSTSACFSASWPPCGTSTASVRSPTAWTR